MTAKDDTYWRLARAFAAHLFATNYADCRTDPGAALNDAMGDRTNRVWAAGMDVETRIVLFHDVLGYLLQWQAPDDDVTELHARILTGDSGR